MKKNIACWSIFLISFFMLAGCKNATTSEEGSTISSSKAVTTATSEISNEKMKEEIITEKMMRLYVNDEEIAVSWEDNAAVDELKKLVSTEPLTIKMSMYGGFEQVGAIGQKLPQNDKQITTSAGDIVLYSGDKIVVFYGSNSWSYTKLGHIDNKTAEELTQLFGNGDVSITINMVAVNH